MPRAAVLSIHARVEGTGPDAWQDPALVQIWGPRFSTYVVAGGDRAVFTLGRLSDDPAKRREAETFAARLRELLGDAPMLLGEAGRALGVNPNRLRYAAPTGTVLIRWDGARQPTIRMAPPPGVDPVEARAELARRYLHTFGPGTAESFATWAGIRPAPGLATFGTLAESLIAVRTPIGAAWILVEDEPGFRAPPDAAAAARLLPSGDTFFLLQGADRELLVPDRAFRSLLWTPRVWPGAVLVEGDVVGTWRRAGAMVTIEPWRRLSPAARVAVEAEAAALPLPGSPGPISVAWVDRAAQLPAGAPASL